MDDGKQQQQKKNMLEMVGYDRNRVHCSAKWIDDAVAW